MSSTAEVTELMQDIMDGKFDAQDLERIQRAIQMRTDNMKRLNAANLNIGDVVRLVDIRPKYLAGVELPVKSRRGIYVFVDIPNSPEYGRFAGAKDVKLKPGMVELVRRARPTLSV